MVGGAVRDYELGFIAFDDSTYVAVKSVLPVWKDEISVRFFVEKTMWTSIWTRDCGMGDVRRLQRPTCFPAYLRVSQGSTLGSNVVALTTVSTADLISRDGSTLDFYVCRFQRPSCCPGT